MGPLRRLAVGAAVVAMCVASTSCSASVEGTPEQQPGAAALLGASSPPAQRSGPGSATTPIGPPASDGVGDSGPTATAGSAAATAPTGPAAAATRTPPSTAPPPASRTSPPAAGGNTTGKTPRGFDACTFVPDGAVLAAIAGLVPKGTRIRTRDRWISRIGLRSGSALGDSCNLRTSHRVGVGVTVIPKISAAAFADTFGHNLLLKSRPVDGIGDAAYLGGEAAATELDLRVGDRAVLVDVLGAAGSAESAVRSAAEAMGRAVAARLPHTVVVPRLLAAPLCGWLDPHLVAGVVGGVPGYSRSYVDDAEFSCSFAGSRGDVAVTVVKGRGADAASDAGVGGVGLKPTSLTIAGHRAYWTAGLGLTMAAGADEVTLVSYRDATEARPSASETGLAANAATVLAPGRWT